MPIVLTHIWNIIIVRYIADADHTGPDRIRLSPTNGTLRIVVGGESNRWLNISRTVTRQGSEDPDSKIFICEVCENRDTIFERCHTSNYTSRIVGAPPVLTANSSELQYCNDYTLILQYTINVINVL